VLTAVEAANDAQKRVLGAKVISRSRSPALWAMNERRVAMLIAAYGDCFIRARGMNLVEAFSKTMLPKVHSSLP
jgi:hypothetical protein